MQFAASQVALLYRGCRFVAPLLLWTLVTCSDQSPPVAVKVAFQSVAANVTAGSPFSVTVAAQDAQSATVSSSTASISISLTPATANGATIVGTTTATAAGGVASFTGLAIQKAGTYTLTASSAGLESAVSTQITIVPGAPAKLGVAKQATGGTAGSTLSSVEIGVEDAFSNRVPSAPVTVAIDVTPGSGPASGPGQLFGTKTATVNASGVATFADLSVQKAGLNYTLTATATGLTSVVTGTFSIGPAAPAKLIVMTQPSNVVAGAVMSPVAVRVADAYDNFLLTNTSQVTLAITSGSGGGAGGALGGTTSVAAVAGLATFSNLTVDKSGTAYTLTATSGTLTSITSSAFNVTPGVATKLGFTTPPANMTAGANFSPVVAIQDAQGNTVTTATGSIALAITAGTGAAGAAIAGTTTVATSNGVATFPGLSIAKAGMGYSLTATSGSLTSAVSGTFDVAVGAASKIVFTAQPGNGVAGATLTPAPAILVQDSAGNTVTSFTGNVTLGITAGTGGAGATITGTSTKAATAGAATFDNLKINKAGAAYTLTASASGLTSGVSAAFDNAIGAPAKLGVVGQPGNSTGGATLSPTLEVAVQDAAGNTIPGATDAIAVAITSGTGAVGATLAGTLTRSAVSGTATFTGLSIDKAATGYTITATATGLTAAVTSAIDVAVGPISQLSFADAPQNGIVGSALLPALRVRGTDAGGNLVTTASNTVTIAITAGTGAGGATLSGATSLALRSGQATFNNLAISAVGTGYSLTASGAGLTSGVSASFDISAAGNVLAFDDQPTEEGAGIAIAPAIKVSVRTPAGAVVTSATNAITLAITSGSGAAGAVLGGTITRDAVAGIATFDNVTVDLIGSGYTLTATAATLVSATSNSFNIISPPQLRLTTAPPASMANRVAFTTQPVVRLSNAAGELVQTAGVIVTAAVTSGGGTLAGTLTATTDATGTATFTDLSLQGTVGAKTITFTTPGYASVAHDITLTPGAAASIAVHAGNNQTPLINSAVAIAPAVKIADADANGVSGTPVTFAVVGGLGGSITGANATSDASGIATVGSWTMSSNTGPHSLQATAAGLTGSPVNFTATAQIQLLADEEQVTGMSGAAGSARHFRIVVPSGAIGLDVSLSAGSGATGNADLYVLQGMQPTTSLYSCRSILSGNDEMCSTANPANATWYIMVSGVTAFTNVTLKASYVMPGDPTNLTIDRVHLTQGSQTYTGTVGLVAGRGALIRVFGKASTSNTATPSVRVRIYKGALQTQEYTITAPGSSVTTVISESELTKSWNVEVPGSAIETGISILAEIDHAGAVTETSDSDNSYPANGTPLALTVHTVPALNVTFVPVFQTPNSRLGDVTTGNVADYVEFTQRLFPISSISTAVGAQYTFSGSIGNTPDSEWTRLLNEIGVLGAADPTRYFYGVFKPASTSSTGGQAAYASKKAIGVDSDLAYGTTGATWRAVTAAHEFGHNFNRKHVNCGSNVFDTDASYPYETTKIGAVGYDLVNNTLIGADARKDIMSYCDPYWISDYTYKGVLSYLTTAAAVAGPLVAAAPTRSLLVWGRVSRGQLIVEPAFEINAVPSVPSGGGAYSIEATDASGARVFGFSFDMEEVDHLPGDGIFAFTVPLPEGRSAQTITVRGNGSQARIARPGLVARGAAIPVATRARTPGRTRLTWDANSYRAALVIDAATNQIIAIGRAGAAEFTAPSSHVDVILSDGASSVRHRSVRPR